MRTLRFRAWDKKRKHMMKGYEVMPRWCEIYPDDNYDIMQFIGLTDKNGIDIYEEDFLRIREKSYATNTWNTYIRKVLWDGISVCLANRMSDSISGLEPLEEVMHKVSHEDAEIEVIGNIYENHELWEET